MAAPFNSRTDAELMRFCTSTYRTLSTLSRRISAGTQPAPEMQAAFTDLTQRLHAAIKELDSRCA